MQKAPVLKSSGLAPIDDEAVHVFGRNLEDRVVSREEESKSEVVEEQKDEDVETIKKRKFETITGEEDEETVFQGDFKLFVWDIATSNWIEKGRGQLKLNDSLDTSGRKSRLIMRTGGTFRIVLNVAIQHSLFKVINNTKTSIRFTDSRNVWAASGSNARQLGDLIDERLAIAAEQAKREKKEDKAVNESEVEDRLDEKYVEIEHRPADEPNAKLNEVEENEEEVEEEELKDEDETEGLTKSEGIEETEKTEDSEDTTEEKVTRDTQVTEKSEETGDIEEKLDDKKETKEEEEDERGEINEETEENKGEVECESKRIKLSSS